MAQARVGGAGIRWRLPRANWDVGAMITDVSGPTAYLAVIVAVVMVALIGLIAVRRAVPLTRLAQHTDVAGYVYAVIGVLYAVILAQVVIAGWEEYQGARTEASSEADAVLILNRLAQEWPQPERSHVNAALAAYAAHVIDVEWPAMAQGDFRSSEHAPVVHELWIAVTAAGRADGDSAVFAAALRQLETLDESRRNRVLIGEGGLPDAMTLTLVLGAVVTVGFSYLFAVDNGWIHAVMTASLALLVALLLLLQYQLENPFDGDSAIQPTAMRFVLNEINRPIETTEATS
jgi:hypothetical protein